MHVVLVEPEIPPNTGNIARTCAATGSVLHLVEPLGFSLSDRYVKRAGLDYWPLVSLQVHPNWEDLAQSLAEKAPWCFFTSHAPTIYTQAPYTDDAVLVFGRESTGLPASILSRHVSELYTIPMQEGVRSLNLSNSVAIVVYEAWRQQSFRQNPLP
ncbi:MAG: tRNA (cytidine(34)-2'-O)-methyltransferase [Firmicutes bacterium]|nr:tRNA (cytidine(34)-2'-O)-methyltransferase [Bacillota bacterium]